MEFQPNIHQNRWPPTPNKLALSRGRSPSEPNTSYAVPVLERRVTFFGFVVAIALVISGCSSSQSEESEGVGENEAASGPSTGSEDADSDDEAPATTEPEPEPIEITLAGSVVSSIDGAPLDSVTLTLADQNTMSDAKGEFSFDDIAVDADTESVTISAQRPVWIDTEIIIADIADLTPPATTVDGPPPVIIEMEPFIVRGLRVSRYVAGDAAEFDALLELANATSVNTLVFDTKDEADTVLYDTEVEYAETIGAVDPVYDPADLIAKAKENGLYTITRIVTFEDATWAKADSEAKLAGEWVNAADQTNWEYPLALAVEACQLGFDEIQFDYVRFPAGRTATVARASIPDTGPERAKVIQAFLGEARALLHPMGCGLSAAIFGIVMSSETDEGIGQMPETVSSSVDAISPMLYPSHYGSGWLGFADPNDHPGPVVAHALDIGIDRMESPSLVRPWLQGFYYNGSQVLAQITETESRGGGWIIWNASGHYGSDWLPSS